MVQSIADQDVTLGLFSLVNPDNELYSVLQVLKRLGMDAIPTERFAIAFSETQASLMVKDIYCIFI